MQTLLSSPEWSGWFGGIALFDWKLLWCKEIRSDDIELDSCKRQATINK